MNYKVPGNDFQWRDRPECGMRGASCDKEQNQRQEERRAKTQPKSGNEKKLGGNKLCRPVKGSKFHGGRSVLVELLSNDTRNASGNFRKLARATEGNRAKKRRNCYELQRQHGV
ncbi:MAG: hypothetical protein ACKO39_11050 [Chthoniobacterales bacterium]